MPQKTTEFGCLTPAFRDQVSKAPLGKKWPKRDEFFRKLRGDYNTQANEGNWVPLRKGTAVPWNLIRGVAGYFSAVWGLPLSEQGIATRCDPPPPSKRKRPRLWDFWKLGWQNVLSTLVDTDSIDESFAFCKTAEDVEAAARIVMECVGRSHEGRKIADTPLAAGEIYMKRSLAQYAAWLRQFWIQRAHTVMFGHIGGQRVSVSVILPLTEDAYQRVRTGQTADHELTPDDYQSPSRRLFFNALAEVQLEKKPSRKRLTMAQGHCALYQLAMCSPIAVGLKELPTMLSLGATSANTRRAEVFGLCPVGTKLKGFDVPLLEVKAPPRHKIPANAVYEGMCATVRVYQAAFSEHWNALYGPDEEV